MDKTETNKTETTFKKPMLVGKIGRLPKKFKPTAPLPPEINETEEITYSTNTDTHPPEPPPPPPQNSTENLKNVPYKEPQWSGLPDESDGYVLEVLKNGSILETINLSKKSFWVFGRLLNCDICMQHPTISRYHAVLQYRSEMDENYDKGYYIYDLESTHGTFLNKMRLKPRTYIKIHVGHMLKLGCSTRTYILNGPEEDKEQESELSVTELKQKRQQELLQRQKEEEEKRKKEEEKGIDWGMGEDADEETDLSENPYAEANNEELYIDNPKKTLRGFFEREGLDLEYDCSEQGIGQFLCKVELPIDDEMGRPIFAEVVHKGKKKEAVVQCALEACRILDRHGLLRQATHESRKRKPKNWEENDYYDSDDDTFLDRTGAIEKKREKRMNAKAPQKAETYENLLEKERKISKSIKDLERELEQTQKKLSSNSTNPAAETDSLDSFMMELKESKPNKKSINKLKFELMRLKQEHGNIIKLVNIAKPASLPPLVAEYATTSVSTSGSSEKKTLPIFGKRKKIKLQLHEKPTELQEAEDDEEEMEETEEIKKRIRPNEEESLSIDKFESFLRDKVGDEYPELDKILENMKVLKRDPNCDREETEFVERKQNELKKLFDGGNNEEISERLTDILNQLLSIMEEKAKINDVTSEKIGNRNVKSTKNDVVENKNEEKKKKHNRKQLQLEEMEKKKGYVGYENTDDYSMWVPPSGQTGDGRTSLNDKYGY